MDGGVLLYYMKRSERANEKHRRMPLRGANNVVVPSECHLLITQWGITVLYIQRR